MSETKIEFISYTGKWPNLCSGEFTLKINGDFERFHYSYLESGEPHKHPAFWHSGGSCGFNGDYSESFINEGRWIIEFNAFPEYLKPYADEIAQLFNDNVPYGCCGGCL